MLRQIVTIAEAQLLTGVSRATIATAIRDGKLPATKLSGRRRRIGSSDLSEWIGREIDLPRQQ
jgi:excisionase family DNA binding protein